MTTAAPDSWKTLPPPEQREDLAFAADFTEAEFDVIRIGLIPKKMEDKWFIFFEDGMLNFHRSWTGAQLYCLQIRQTESRWMVSSSWVNRDPTQYRATDTAYDRALVQFLIDALLLKKQVMFPMPTGAPSAQDAAIRHRYVGRA